MDRRRENPLGRVISHKRTYPALTALSEWRVNRPERRTQADLLVVISLHLEQRKVVIGVEHDVWSGPHF